MPEPNAQIRSLLRLRQNLRQSWHIAGHYRKEPPLVGKKATHTPYQPTTCRIVSLQYLFYRPPRAETVLHSKYIHFFCFFSFYFFFFICPPARFLLFFVIEKFGAATHAPGHNFKILNQQPFFPNFFNN